MKKIAAIVPGPAVAFIGQWFDLFLNSPLTYPQWQNDAAKIALGIGAFVAIVSCLILKSAPKGLLLGLTLGGLALTLILLGGCLWIHFHLGPPTPSIPDVRWWQDIWEYVYIAAMVFLVATITFGGLYVGEERPILFWIIFAVIVVIILAIGAYVLWLWWR